MKSAEQRRPGRPSAFTSATLALAVGLSVAAPLPAAAAIRVPAGTTFHAELASADINTKNAQAGDQFRMLVVAPYPNGNAAYAGAKVYGHILQVSKGSQGRKAQLKLAFDSMTLASGVMSPVSATVVKLESTPENTVARKALGAGAGAAVGSQTIGRLLGGTLGGVVGIVGGAAGGYLYGNNDKPNFNVATGAKVTIQTTSTAELMHRQAR